MTEMKFIDKRENTAPTFGDLKIGDSFTPVNEEMPFVKTAVVYDKHQKAYNTISLEGEFDWSDDDEEVEPIQEVEIVIKK